MDTLAADDLAKQGAKATAAMVLTLFSCNISVLAAEGLDIGTPKNKWLTYRRHHI